MRTGKDIPKDVTKEGTQKEEKGATKDLVKYTSLKRESLMQSATKSRQKTRKTRLFGRPNIKPGRFDGGSKMGELKNWKE